MFPLVQQQANSWTYQASVSSVEKEACNECMSLDLDFPEGKNFSPRTVSERLTITQTTQSDCCKQVGQFLQ